jgi:ubiquinone/menaquinone biosynthesis C-methylase UbiE
MPNSQLLTPEPERQDGLDTVCVSVREGYQLWAASYDGDPNPLLALEKRALCSMLPNLQCKDALDIGCGTGRWLGILLALGARSAVGVDFATEMIVRAAAKPMFRNRLVLGDCLMLPLRAHVADVVVCSFTIGHVLHTRALAHELARVARPQADLFVTDLHPKAQARGWRCAFHHADKTVQIRTFVHAPEDLRRSFEYEGFKLVKSGDFRLGEPERQIFRVARKDNMFETACSMPAVLVLHFRLAR